MNYTISIKKLSDADYVTTQVDQGLKQGLSHLTVEWAQQTYNRSQWEPRPWPNEDKLADVKAQEVESHVEQQERRKASDELIQRQKDPYA